MLYLDLQLPLIPPAEWESIAEGVRTIHRSVTPSRPPPDLIYHYTDSAGLKGIVESGLIRATYVSFMNDAREYLHAARLLHANVRRVAPSVVDPAGQRLLALLDTCLTGTTAANLEPYFIACFSTAEDSLNQWRAYGRGEGGFAIGFDGKELAAGASGLPALVAPVIYDREAQEALVRQLLEWALTEYRAISQNYPPSQQQLHLEQWQRALFLVAGQLASLVKDPAFAEEREWRIIYRATRPNEISFLAKQTMLSGFVELGLGVAQSHPNALPAEDPGRKRALPDRLPIRVLWTGPGRLKDLSQIAGKALLENNGYDGVRLETSPIEFRIVT